MKKILNIIILFAAVVFCGCSDFDDSELRGRIDGYKNRIEALKAKAETLGKQLADLSYLTNGNVITTVSQDADGKYVVTYKDNKDVEHTVVLATMDDIVDVPIIGVKLDENGVYYWTKCIDGEITWLTDDDGEKFPVSGYTPTISVDADGCWTVDGVQILDASGNPIKATTDATSVFRSAELDGDGNFSLTLGDGSTITLRVFNSLNLKLDAMPVTTVADPSKSITVSYELSGEAKETAIVAVAKAEGLDAVIDRDAKTVTVSFDASFSRGTVIVMAYDLADNVIVKPLFYKAATLGTVAISTPDQLVAFAAAVNAGGEEAAAKAVLTQDIDMKDVAWTPIGNGAYTTANAMTGPAFQGTFDGQGHTVRNLKIVVPADAAAGSAWGLFGVLKGATVRNLAIGEGSSVVSTAAAMTAVGAVAGYAYEATIENCENRAAIDIQGGGDNVRESAGGIVGAICANENDSHILSCTNYGKITSKNSVNTKNGATGFSIGGIVGFADASTTTERYNNVVGCVNEGAIDAQATRTAGVVATMNKYTKLESCVNNAAVTCSDVTASNSRVAGIVSAMGGHTYLTSCVNNGTVAFAVAGDTTHGYAAGIAGQTNDNNTAIDGCENYGAVLSDIINAAANKYIGIVCANTNKKTIAIRNCKIGGRIGPFSDGQQGATEITEQNFEQYIYFTLTGGGVPTLENNSFSGGPAKPGIATVEDLTAFRDAVNAGESTAQWEDAGGVVSLLGDIDMKDVAGWTPIGNASYKWEKNLLTIEGNAFKGTFDGQGYALKNLQLAYGGSAANTAYGLFGVLDGATVRNLTVGAALGDASALKVTASGGTAEVGVIAGVCRDANVSDCVNYAKIEYDGTSAARVSAAMVGFIFSETEGTKLERLQNYGAVEADTHGNSANGGNTAIHMAGICGFATGNATNKICNDIAYCDNYGNITSNSARSSGIVAAANRYTEIENCVNEGDNVNAFATVNSARIGNITCITAVGSKITNTVNRGNVICKTSGAAGGIICLVNDDGNAFVGCENYGLVITDRANYKGTLFGQCNKAARFSDCIAQGDLGAYEDGSYALVGVNYTNYMSYIGDHNATAVHVNSQNILYYPNGSQVPAEPEFGVNLSSVELNAQGSNAAVVQLSSVDYDWTVSADGDWAHITDLSDVPVVSGVKDPGVQYIKIGADANTKTAPRSAVVTFASTDGSKSATVRVDQQARGEAFPSKWVFQASTLPLYGSSWTDDNVIPATSGAAGFISVVRGDANASAAFKRSVVTNRPAVSTMVEGDYWLYTFPVENLAAGSVVDFNATMAGEANSPKYFIVEYLDGGVWKSVEADLLTAPENPAVRYTYKCSGTATGSSYQHATVMQTMRFENAVTDGEVKIRCRAVGPYTCAGGTQNITATNAASSIPPYGFTGSYVQNFGTATPRDTKKVLCLGNSFSYYSNPAWMLKEIAWREGHALNIKAHFKGSQTLTQHLSLGFSTDVIEQGGYDFAFLQDQSQNPANYGRDATASILTGLTTLADKMRAASPSCKVILEETWTFSSASYGGFTDFPTFETYNDAGAKAMAKAAGTWVSPIGPAFRQVREGGSGINLYYSDSMHQSEYGAYLKACVNYLVLFGERFGADPADCGLNPDKAAYLRSVAEQIVLGNEGDYFIER